MTMWTEKGDRFGDAVHRRSVTVNAKPFDQNSPYTRRGGTNRHVYGSNPWSAKDIYGYVPVANGYGLYPPGLASATNKALDKLYEQMEQAESLRVAWKERGKALEMVTSSLRTVVRVARACKRRDPRIIRAILDKDPTKRDILKTPSDIWLAYHFGIVPTISDIHHAAGVFSYDPPVMKLVGAGTVVDYKNGDGAFGYRHQRCSVKLGGEVYQFDPNVSLASRLGFAQPLSVAWEMTPFSWFVDYFVNVGSLIKNMEPRFPGIKTRNEYNTLFVRYPETLMDFWGDGYMMSGYFVSRSRGWPNYQLEFPVLEGLKLQQCSYIASVAIQLLSSMKK